MDTIGIIGCGWLGLRLANHLKGKFDIYTTTTSLPRFDILQREGFNPSLVKFNGYLDEVLVWDNISKIDKLVIAIPLSTRSDSEEAITFKIQNIIKFLGDFKGQIILISTTSVYPKEKKIYTEVDCDPHNQLIESQFLKKFPTITILRLGGLMGDDRLLSRYSPRDLHDIVNHIHYIDACRIIEMLIKKDHQYEVYNGVAPKHPTKLEVIASQTNTIYDEVSAQLSQRIIDSDKLVTTLDYQFSYPDPLFFH